MPPIQSAKPKGSRPSSEAAPSGGAGGTGGSKGGGSNTYSRRSRSRNSTPYSISSPTNNASLSTISDAGTPTGLGFVGRDTPSAGLALSYNDLNLRYVLNLTSPTFGSSGGKGPASKNISAADVPSSDLLSRLSDDLKQIRGIVDSKVDTYKRDSKDLSKRLKLQQQAASADGPRTPGATGIGAGSDTSPGAIRKKKEELKKREAKGTATPIATGEIKKINLKKKDRNLSATSMEMQRSKSRESVAARDEVRPAVAAHQLAPQGPEKGA